MDYLDILEVSCVHEAVMWLSQEDEYIGEVIAFQLTGEPGLRSKDLLKASKSLDNVCCGYNDGVFRIKGDLWSLGRTG